MSELADPVPEAGIRIVDVLDRLLDRGVVVRGEIWLTVADVDLVFIGADLVLASADRMRAGRGSVGR
ncbi:MAG: gas vesicle protein [Pikeienuella sp.]